MFYFLSCIPAVLVKFPEQSFSFIKSYACHGHCTTFLFLSPSTHSRTHTHSPTSPSLTIANFPAQGHPHPANSLSTILTLQHENSNPTTFNFQRAPMKKAVPLLKMFFFYSAEPYNSWSICKECHDLWDAFISFSLIMYLFFFAIFPKNSITV